MSLGVNCFMHMYNDYRAATGGGGGGAKGGGRRRDEATKGVPGQGRGLSSVQCLFVFVRVYCLFPCVCWRAYLSNFRKMLAQASLSVPAGRLLWGQGRRARKKCPRNLSPLTNNTGESWTRPHYVIHGGGEAA